MSAPYLIIKGKTLDGNKFRPSDWAERLCGAVASYGPGRRIIFHPKVRLASIEGIKCVVVDTTLRQQDEMLYDFLIDFARDNQLQQEESERFPGDDD